MKPSRIRVFDGLRVATEHIDHLQDALHSSIADIRQVLGLGKVFYGFDVQPQGENAVVVGPGLAFDRRRNRVVVDEPTLVDVSFTPGQETRYVCVRHQAVEDGEVEGRSTLIWDSAEVVLHDTLPAPDEDLVPIAKVVRPADATDASFQIVTLVPAAIPPQIEPSGTPPETVPTAGEGLPVEGAESVSPDEPPPSGATSAPGSPASAEETVEPPVAGGEQPVPASEPGAAVPADASPAATTSMEIAPSPSPQGTLRIRQGILDLPRAAAADPGPLAAMAAALRSRLSNGASDDDVRVVLAATEVAVDFVPSALSCMTSVSTNLQLASGSARRCEATAHGEATFADGAFSQFALSSVHSPPAQTSSAAWSGPRLTDGSLAHLPLGALAVDEEAVPRREALEHLQLAVEATTAAPSGFGVSCALVWKGDISEDSVTALEDGTLSLSWGARVGWKALGG